MFTQANFWFFDTIRSKYQCDFRKGLGAQHCLITLLKKWRESIDRGLESGIFLTELSKAFDFLPHDLFIAKLFAYGSDHKALRFIYVIWGTVNKELRLQTHNSWKEILYGVPQGSILGPLLFKADLCDLFITMNHYVIANYADDNKPYVSGRNIKRVVASLEEVSEVIFQWFRDNQFQGTASKCHVLLSTDK